MVHRNPKDTAAYLWDYLYMVRVPQLQATSVDHMRLYGNYITGDQGIDKTLANQWMTTMMPISRMVELYREGVQIRVVQQSDVKVIYESISNHLEAWRDRLERGINIGDAPIDDLIAMDEFAHAIYEHAKYHFTPETVSSELARRLESVGRFNANNFFKTKLTPSTNQTDGNGKTTINAIEENAPPERESLGDFLKERLVTLKRWDR